MTPSATRPARTPVVNSVAWTASRSVSTTQVARAERHGSAIHRSCRVIEQTTVRPPVPFGHGRADRTPAPRRRHPRDAGDPRLCAFAHLTTVDVSLRYLLLPQLTAIVDGGGEAIGVQCPRALRRRARSRGNPPHRRLQSSTRSMNIVADLRSAAELWRDPAARATRRLAHAQPQARRLRPHRGTTRRRARRRQHRARSLRQRGRPRAKRLVVYGLEAFAARFSHAELVQNPEDVDAAASLPHRPAPQAHVSRQRCRSRSLRSQSPAAGARASRCAAELGVDDDDVVVGIVGRLVAEKGYPELFDAVARLGPRCVLVVVGPDDPEKADALDRALIEQRTRRRCALPRHARRRRAPLRGDGRVRVCRRIARGFLALAMEAAAMGLPDRRDRHPRLPAGRRPRRQRPARAGRATRRASPTRCGNSPTTPRCDARWARRARDERARVRRTRGRGNGVATPTSARCSGRRAQARASQAAPAHPAPAREARVRHRDRRDGARCARAGAGRRRARGVAPPRSSRVVRQATSGPRRRALSPYKFRTMRDAFDATVDRCPTNSGSPGSVASCAPRASTSCPS